MKNKALILIIVLVVIGIASSFYFKTDISEKTIIPEIIPELFGALISDTFTTPGVNSWTAPTEVTAAKVECWGGGGGGGGQNLSSDGGGGGGGGAYAQKTTYTVTPDNSYYVYVGAGGTGGSGACGTNGQGSSFGASEATASSTLLAAPGWKGCNSTGVPPAGGVGGQTASSTGDIKYAGGNGGAGINSANGYGGPGGSSAGTASTGTSGSDPWSTVTAAAAPDGGGIGGDGGGKNLDGLAPVSGNGGGGGGSGEGSPVVGGNGTGGKCIITYNPSTGTGELYLTSYFNDANLKAYWRLEGNSNDAKNANNGTDTNITYGINYGKFNQGATTTGSSKIALASGAGTDLDITGNLTIVFWIKTTDNNKYIIGFNDGTNGAAGYGLVVGAAGAAAGKMKFASGSSSGGSWSGDNTTAINDGTWRHIGVVLSGTNVYFYMNGSPDGSTSVSYTPSSWSGARNIFMSNTSTLGLKGSMDDVAVFNRALSDSEVNDIYEGTPAPSGTIPNEDIIIFE